MAKALIIKGANFADNKVRTITLSDPVDCTGISLNKSTASITNIGSTIRNHYWIHPISITVKKPFCTCGIASDSVNLFRNYQTGCRYFHSYQHVYELSQ